MDENLRLLFLSPEAVPFAKTGGLADVAGSLPPALKRLGADVRLVLPYYRSVRSARFSGKPTPLDLRVPLGGAGLSARVIETVTGDGVPVYLVEREDLYDRPHLYGDGSDDYYDNLERFAFFAHAALRAAEAMAFEPHVVHAHDWQGGLAPALLKGPYRKRPVFKNTASVFTIHNIAYAGIFPADKLVMTGLSGQDVYHPEGIEYWGGISLLKAGIVYSDAVTTVSPTYAKELQTPEYGMGMEGVLRHRRESFHGILNGVDYAAWHPARDPAIPDPYAEDDMAGKAGCKDALIREMALDPSLRHRPLLGVVSRLDPQKGLDLLPEILNKVLALDAGLVLLGSGIRDIQDAMERAAGRHPGRMAVRIGFDDSLARRIMAGADMLLIPSRYEPCGLTQMYALKYGTVPVVRATGGLEDTVSPFDRKTGEGTGFKFGPGNAEAFLGAIREAVALFDDADAWKRLVANGMKADFSWERSARRYMRLYESLLT